MQRIIRRPRRNLFRPHQPCEIELIRYWFGFRGKVIVGYGVVFVLRPKNAPRLSDVAAYIHRRDVFRDAPPNTFPRAEQFQADS